MIFIEQKYAIGNTYYNNKWGINAVKMVILNPNSTRVPIAQTTPTLTTSIE